MSWNYKKELNKDYLTSLLDGLVCVEVRVGFEEAYVEIEEDASKVELCVSISGLNNVIQKFEFQLEVSTEEVTASELI